PPRRAATAARAHAVRADRVQRRAGRRAPRPGRALVHVRRRGAVRDVARGAARLRDVDGHAAGGGQRGLGLEQPPDRRQVQGARARGLGGTRVLVLDGAHARPGGLPALAVGLVPAAAQPRRRLGTAGRAVRVRAAAPVGLVHGGRRAQEDGLRGRDPPVTRAASWTLAAVVALAAAALLWQGPFAFYSPDVRYHTSRILRSSEGELFVDPFAGTLTIYPGLFHFLWGRVQRATGWNALQIARLASALNVVGILGAFFFLARQALRDRERAALATLALPLVLFAPTGRYVLLADPGKLSVAR